jgi:hypothetical protein
VGPEVGSTVDAAGAVDVAVPAGDVAVGAGLVGDAVATGGVGVGGTLVAVGTKTPAASGVLVAAGESPTGSGAEMIITATTITTMAIVRDSIKGCRIVLT